VKEADILVKEAQHCVYAICLGQPRIHVDCQTGDVVFTTPQVISCPDDPGTHALSDGGDHCIADEADEFPINNGMPEGFHMCM